MSANNYKKLILKLGPKHSDMLYDIAQQLNCSNLRALQVCLASEFKLQSKTGRYWRAKPVKARTLFLTMSMSELLKKDLLEKHQNLTFTGLCMNAIAACHHRLFARNVAMASHSSLVKYLPHFSHETGPNPRGRTLSGASV